MASAETEYRKLQAQAMQQLKETGKVDSKLMAAKGEAGIAMRDEQRRARRGDKAAAQEAYIRSFEGEATQKAVRDRLSGKPQKA